MRQFQKGDLIVEAWKREKVFVVVSPPAEVIFLFKGRPVSAYLIKESTTTATTLYCFTAKELEDSFTPLVEAYSTNLPAAPRP